MIKNIDSKNFNAYNSSKFQRISISINDDDWDVLFENKFVIYILVELSFASANVPEIDPFLFPNSFPPSITFPIPTSWNDYLRDANIVLLKKILIPTIENNYLSSFPYWSFGTCGTASDPGWNLRAAVSARRVSPETIIIRRSRLDDLPLSPFWPPPFLLSVTFLLHRRISSHARAASTITQAKKLFQVPPLKGPPFVDISRRGAIPF